MNSATPTFEGPVCPRPLDHQDQIVMGHGSGGRMSHDLIQRVFSAAFSNPVLDQANDSARLTLPSGRMAVSTDCHIVAPLFFPGGDIGRLAVCGTVNDVAMSGAVPLYLTAGFILEEGLPISVLQRVVASMQAAAQEAGIQIVAGDTKVVEKGKADGLFITTAGVGWLPEDRQIGGELAAAGDQVLLSGPVGQHGMAVLAARGELGFQAEITSDVAPLNGLIQELLAAAPHTHVLRDPTRGGLATTLNEIAVQSQVSIRIDETAVPILPTVRTVCEMLGFDPLYVANEGKLIAIVPPEELPAALSALRAHPYGAQAAHIGTVQSQDPGRVLLRTQIGGTRLLDKLAGEMLPRIC